MKSPKDKAGPLKKQAKPPSLKEASVLFERLVTCQAHVEISRLTQERNELKALWREAKKSRDAWRDEAERANEYIRRLGRLLEADGDEKPEMQIKALQQTIAALRKL